LPVASAIPATIATSTMRLTIALPITTKGFRALLERSVGISTVSGSMAVRGLRGVRCLEFFAVMELMPIPFTNRSEIGGYGSPAPGTALPGSREYGTDACAAGRSGAVLGSTPVAPATMGFGPAGEVRVDAEGATGAAPVRVGGGFGNVGWAGGAARLAGSILSPAPACAAGAAAAGRSPPPDGGSGFVTTVFLSLHSA
jgi:hypothetical protein